MTPTKTYQLTLMWHDFLSDPKNLKTITPDYMGFDILSGAEKKDVY